MSLGFELQDPIQRAMLKVGLESCREGEWEIGVRALLDFAADAPNDRALPSLVYSYLGYGLTRTSGHLDTGPALCRWAAGTVDRTSEHVRNLALSLLSAGKRGEAVEALDSGLRSYPEDAELKQLRRSLGRRQSPVVPFLARDNAANRLLGRWRSRRT